MDGGFFQQQPRVHDDANVIVRAALAGMQVRLRPLVLRRLKGDIQAADDVLQDLAVRALIRAPELREVGCVQGWLLSILRSVIADHWRRFVRRREDLCEPQHLADWLIAPEVEEDEAEPCPHLREHIARLKPAQAELLVKVDLEGETQQEAAHRLGILSNALYVRLHRARRALRTEMQTACETCLDRLHCDGPLRSMS